MEWSAVKGDRSSVKMQKEAVENGDHIYGVLRGIELNNDGSDKVGLCSWCKRSGRGNC